MSQQIQVRDGTLAIEAEMTIYESRQLQQELTSVLQEQPDIRQVDLARVTALDAAGLQLLLGLRQWGRQHDRPLGFTEPSAAVREVLELLQLDLAPVGAEVRS